MKRKKKETKKPTPTTGGGMGLGRSGPGTGTDEGCIRRGVGKTGVRKRPGPLGRRRAQTSLLAGGDQAANRVWCVCPTRIGLGVCVAASAGGKVLQVTKIFFGQQLYLTRIATQREGAKREGRGGGGCKRDGFVSTFLVGGQVGLFHRNTPPCNCVVATRRDLQRQDLEGGRRRGKGGGGKGWAAMGGV